uniref:Reverse transcriptase domain-containing protein n=1 Tax=Gouania willdenowi TaxID=441366 RepID=A0A8C5DQC3_GOUWI
TTSGPIRRHLGSFCSRPPLKLKGNQTRLPLSPLLFAIFVEPLAAAVHYILLYLEEPQSSLEVFNLININFDKSEIMILDNVIKTEPPYIEPFRWTPSGFNYLGVRIVPQLNQLYSENITPLVKSFLGRINLIKMNVLPKILYPTSMLFVNLGTNDIANINKALSEFIWNGRKPKVKLARFQLPRKQGGWGLPNIEYYVLSLQARIISAWVNGSSRNESGSIVPCSLQ